MYRQRGISLELVYPYGPTTRLPAGLEPLKGINILERKMRDGPYCEGSGRMRFAPIMRHFQVPCVWHSWIPVRATVLTGLWYAYYIACSSARAQVRNVCPIKVFLLFDAMNRQVSQSLPAV